MVVLKAGTLGSAAELESFHRAGNECKDEKPNGVGARDGCSSLGAYLKDNTVDRLLRTSPSQDHHKPYLGSTSETIPQNLKSPAPPVTQHDHSRDLTPAHPLSRVPVATLLQEPEGTTPSQFQIDNNSSSALFHRSFCILSCLRAVGVLST